MTDYVSAEQVIALNVALGGGVRDEIGIRAAVDRPSASFSGHELYADIWSKAGSLLHGIASTQHFLDGNKRTAWVATEFFLRINGKDLRPLPRIAKEAFVLSVATGLFDVDQAAEWLRENRVRSKDRLDYAVLAWHAEFDAELPSIWDATGAALSGVTTSIFPSPLVINVVFRIRWRLSDVGIDQQLKVTVHTVSPGPEVVTLDALEPELDFPLERPARTGHPHHPDGVMPFIGIQPVPLIIRRPGRARIVLWLNGEALVSLPISFENEPDLTTEDAFNQLL